MVEKLMKGTVYTITLLALALSAYGCQTSTDILAGATHACGNMHVEGYFTDSQGEVVVVKAPEDWTPEQVLAFCNGGE
jgi:hypothetical protein